MQHNIQECPSAHAFNLIKFAIIDKSKPWPRAPYRNDASPSPVPQSSCASTSVVTSHGAGGLTGARAPHWPRKWTDNPRSSRLKGRAELTRVPLLKSTSCQIIQFLIAPHALMRNHKFIGWSRTWYSSSHMKKKISHIHSIAYIHSATTTETPVHLLVNAIQISSQTFMWYNEHRYRPRASSQLKPTWTFPFDCSLSQAASSHTIDYFASLCVKPSDGWSVKIPGDQQFSIIVCENPRGTEGASLSGANKQTIVKII